MRQANNRKDRNADDVEEEDEYEDYFNNKMNEDMDIV